MKEYNLFPNTEWYLTYYRRLKCWLVYYNFDFYMVPSKIAKRIIKSINMFHQLTNGMKPLD